MSKYLTRGHELEIDVSACGVIVLGIVFVKLMVTRGRILEKKEGVIYLWRRVKCKYVEETLERAGGAKGPRGPWGLRSILGYQTYPPQTPSFVLFLLRLPILRCTSATFSR